MRHTPRARLHHSLAAVLALATFGFSPPACHADPGRLFYTPEQRARLEAARTRKPSPPVQQATPAAAAPVVRFDGVVVRSDGSETRWVNGRAQVGSSAVPGLKPGQIRADGKVYEPYQVLRQDAAEAPTP